MGYGDEKVIVQVTETDDGLEHTDAAGKTHTYYRCSKQFWLDVLDLQVRQNLRDPPEGQSAAPTMVTTLTGLARFEDYGISVIGEPSNRSQTVALHISAAAAPVKEAQVSEEDELFNKPLGGAHLGFNRADWEIGNSDEWFLSCYVDEATLQTLTAAVTAGTMKSMSLAFRMRNLYTTEIPYAPPSVKFQLFLRPDKSDNSIGFPQTALGHLLGLSLKLSSIDMRPTEVPEDAPEEERMEVREVPPDPVAVAVASLASTVAALRSTVRWVGGIAAAALVILAFK